MKSNLPHPKRLSKEEEKVISWAFILAHSNISGNYNLPKPMEYALENLYNAVSDLAHARGISIADGCTERYLGFREGFENKKPNGR